MQSAPFPRNRQRKAALRSYRETDSFFKIRFQNLGFQRGLIQIDRLDYSSKQERLKDDLRNASSIPYLSCWKYTLQMQLRRSIPRDFEYYASLRETQSRERIEMSSSSGELDMMGNRRM